MTSTSEIRSGFLNYFGKHGHEIVSSSPLVPRNDPTLLFTNAGMVQFKNVFVGAEQRPYDRATTSQKCVRAGGKHNDLENVGYTARHHTFFEMLGNFSFGDYFKDVAIELAWNLVTKEYDLDPARLLVTVYSEDEDAADLWRKIAGLTDDRIIRIPTSDNFWAMGDTGPCGPCSEIFYDHGPSVSGGPPGSPDEDGDRFIEIWNLVFMQYEQVSAQERTNLPKPSIDTGMGLERVSALLQGKHDNYETDLIRALIKASAEASNSDPDGECAISHRVIADHLRACSFLVADGVLPSNEGRGYVLRRIMRRGMRHAHLLGCEEPLLWQLVPALVNEMGQAFPELVRAKALIEETFKLEETRFKEMLGRGLRLLEQETQKLGDGGTLAGDVAFRLYDTFGFPLDLTQDILRGQGRTVDEVGFDNAMQRQREAARKAWAGSGEAATDEVWFDIREETGSSEFLGYDTESAEGILVAIVVDGKCRETLETGMKAMLIVNQTPFYAESGGQMGDQGILSSVEGAEFIVEDTVKRLEDLHVHIGTLRGAALSIGASVEMRVDCDRRRKLRANHSVTHLLHAALRQHLGEHVAQKGSLVAPDYLRFDFSNPKPVSVDEMSRIESDVNSRVRENAPVVTLQMTPDDAQKAGAVALFGEKYGEEVRVVSMGKGGKSLKPDIPYSMELCGGTHVSQTGDIGFFKIISESAVASGVRRVEAVTGEAAVRQVEARDAIVDAAAKALNTAPSEIPARVTALLQERREMEREMSTLRRKLGEVGGGSVAPELLDLNGVSVATRVLIDVPAKELKPLVDAIKGQVGSGVVAVVSVIDGKASLVVGVTEDLTDRLNAVDLVRVGSASVGGKGGGGRPDMAQAGGPDGAAAEAAIKAIEQAIAAMR
ncbi:MAG: alanine--tRNA ligase [Rickettsiales bacterium]|nr:alanine--tRNA ligase [Rickettsiales bacterium]